MATIKIRAVVNSAIPFGVAVNALAHASVGLGAKLRRSEVQLDVRTIDDAAGRSHSGILMSRVHVQRASSEKIREVRKGALEAGLDVVDFADTMTGDTYVEQLEKTKSLQECDLVYYALVVAGSEEKVDGAFSA